MIDTQLTVWGLRTILPVANYDAAQQARREQGDVTRRRILAELARRERDHESAPTWSELGAILGVADRTARYHCARLRAAGMVDFTSQHRTLRLTHAGREKA